MSTRLCHYILYKGFCKKCDCPHDHNILACEACGFIAKNPSHFDWHKATPKHHAITSGEKVQVYCTICSRKMASWDWDGHVRGWHHQKAAADAGVSPEVQPADAPEPTQDDDDKDEGTEICSVCGFSVKASMWKLHLESSAHLRKEKFQKYRAAVERTEQDKNGLRLEGEFDLGYLDPDFAGAGVPMNLSVCSEEEEGRFVLYDLKLSSKQGGRVVDSGFEIVSYCLGKEISSFEPLHLTLEFKQKFIGRYEDRLELTFRDTIRAIVGSEADHEALKAVAPYIPRRQITRPQETTVIPGVAPHSVQSVRYVTRIPYSGIPKGLLNLLDKDMSPFKQLAKIKEFYLSDVLNTETYASHFKGLLWIEEHRSDLDLARYDMTDATMSKFNQYYYLAVPGLAERRPSVLVGDRILVQAHGSEPGKWFEGHVHVVRQNEVGLRFDQSFDNSEPAWSNDQKYNVRFKLNRTLLRRVHHALDSTFSEERVLFPEWKHVPTHLRQEDIGSRKARVEAEWANLAPDVYIYNGLVKQNPRQLEAVDRIVKQRPGSVPFIVFGPPGIGKTITVVEAMYQVLQSDPNARILACAPSNSAADILAFRLGRHITSASLFRLYAPSRSKNDVPDDLQGYTYQRQVTKDAVPTFSVPPMFELKSFRVVVTTCVSASMLAGVGLERGWFSHIFVDEAGQATEPEIMIPVKTLADSKTNIVLSGDPRQLGPVVRSAITRKVGLDKSWLERLMERECYDVHEGHGVTVVKLTKNFRSHPSILKFPNNHFYAGDLEPYAREDDVNAHLDSPFLPEKGDENAFPIVFHAVLGKDDRESTSPSFFNVDEILQVKSYVRALKESRSVRTTDNDIGIIAPYHAQCLKLRSALRPIADSVKIGSVEEFQGQERKVIIISTVRSSTDFVDYDLRHTLGFVANPRRFNVAMTRAKALLIIVGNPEVLSLDPLWRSFLNYIYLNGGWVGPDITWDPEVPVEVDTPISSTITSSAASPTSSNAPPTPDTREGEDTAKPRRANYDAAVRKQAEIDMVAFTKRMEAMTLQSTRASGGAKGDGAFGGKDPLEADVNIERPWTRADAE